jgi:NhaP-type Na+/H+ or K+/H+ antiporter
MFFLDFLVSVLIGAAHGILAALCLKHFRFFKDSYMNEILIIFFFAYSSFSITEAIHYSGVLSLLVAGIITGDYAW